LQLPNESENFALHHAYDAHNATVVDDAIRFVSSKTNANLKSATEGDKEESNEPDYNEDDDQLEEEVGEITNNQVF
jgi:hypothetical protein